MKSNRWFWGVLAATALLGVVYYFIKEETPYQKPTQEQTSERVTFLGNAMTEEVEGKKKWDLTAEKIETENGTKRIILTRPQILYYQTDGSTVQAVAEQGIVNSDSRDIQLIGAVKAVSSTGTTLTCDESLWQGKAEVFQAAGHVVITREDTVATGDKAEGEKKLDKFKLMGNAKIVKGGAGR